ncbi:unnamed protein product, partial [Mesorhabditis belari]|uniref:Methionine synthase reductase n=1 Tax=Mesorhabditis belari TaxID=2138241 RepID=A0AAF3F3S2_9BILA
MDFLIAYGSHTGQADSIAHQLQEKCELLGFKPRLFSLEENGKSFFIEKESLVVVIVSSTGDGDPPENAARFLRKISARSLDANYLSDLSYALLGLGDSNYSTYQGTPRKVDKNLARLGAKKIIDTAEADDEIGLEVVVEPWIERLLKKLCEIFDIPLSNLDNLQSTVPKTTIAKPVVDLKLSKISMGDAPETPSIKVLKANDYAYPGETSLIKALRVPVSPLTYLISSVTHEKFDPKSVTWQNGERFPGAHGKPIDVTVVGTTLLTSPNAHKPKREIIIDLGENLDNAKFEPGDAFYFLQPNPEEEVNFILERMGLLTLADQKCGVEVDKNATKPNAAVPGYIPPTSSLRYIFTHCLDIRRSPGRPVLRIFAEATEDEAEKRRLLELCSAQGMAEFTAHVRQAAVSIVDVLLAFPGVRPSPERLMEQLPRLMPRPYSVANSFERCNGRPRFIYSQLDFADADGRRYKRLGLATEWLNLLRVNDKIQVIMKEPSRFRLPPPPLTWNDVSSMPLLMIGPGTGVSTFLSFMDKILHEKLTNGQLETVPRLLFFGCRTFEKDYICKNELESYVREGIIDELITCQSQPTKPVSDLDKYVQEALKRRSAQIFSFLELPKSRVFVCGDAKAMSKDTWECFVQILVQNKGCTDMEARAYLNEMKKNDRYVEDVWA